MEYLGPASPPNFKQLENWIKYIEKHLKKKETLDNKHPRTLIPKTENKVSPKITLVFCQWNRDGAPRMSKMIPLISGDRYQCGGEVRQLEFTGQSIGEERAMPRKSSGNLYISWV